jgi:hypothetical protein
VPAVCLGGLSFSLAESSTGLSFGEVFPVDGLPLWLSKHVSVLPFDWLVFLMPFESGISML